MVGELERCRHCHRRFPPAFGHRCTQGGTAVPLGDDVEREFREWLETNAGRFAQYLASRPAC